MKKVLMVIVCVVISIGTIACTKVEKKLEYSNDKVKETYNFLLKRINDQAIFYKATGDLFNNIEVYATYVRINNDTMDMAYIGDIKEIDISQLTTEYIENNYLVEEYEITNTVNLNDDTFRLTLLSNDSSGLEECFIFLYVEEDYFVFGEFIDNEMRGSNFYFTSIDAENELQALIA